MVRAHETLKATAIGAYAEDLKTKFQSWKEKDDWGAFDPVIAFGTGEATFDLARVLSKPIKAAVRIKRGTGRTSWFIKEGDWYVEASHILRYTIYDLVLIHSRES
jgi:hypothetical protein